MQFFNVAFRTGFIQGSGRKLRRQLAPLLLAGLAACAAEPVEQGEEGFVKGFFGGVAADEPRAVQVGRRVLSSGGTAADAATAVYFTLAVTLPSSASLGGGGVCVYFDQKTKKTEALDFLTRAPRQIPAAVARPTAVPGNALGFFALHARFGKLPWASMVSPGERLARFGTPISRALSRQLAPVAGALVEDPESRKIFTRSNGDIVAEGDVIRQIDLSAMLAKIRVAGPGDLYRGRGTKLLVEAVLASGGSLSVEDLRAFRPVWRDTVRVRYGNKTAHFAPPPAAAGLLAAQMFAMLADDDRFKDAGAGEREHLIAETAMRAFAERARWLNDDFTSSLSSSELTGGDNIRRLMQNYRDDRHLPVDRLAAPPVRRPENPSSTGFVVIDQEGSAAACVLTMNNGFGVGRIARGTGIMMAAVPRGAGRGPISIGPMISIRHKSNQFEAAFAVGGSQDVPGGVAAPTALINVAARVLLTKQKLNAAMSAKRVHHGGAPDLTYYEPDFDAATLNYLGQRGHKLAATKNMGLVNAAYCSGGLPRDPESCAVSSDSRGAGLAAVSEQ